MNPNDTLARIIDAAVKGDRRELLTTSNDLWDWLRKGGSPPDDPRDGAFQTGVWAAKEGMV